MAKIKGQRLVKFYQYFVVVLHDLTWLNLLHVFLQSNNNNGKRPWTVDETITFLRLLRRYPLLYVQGRTKSMIGYTKSLIQFATECDKACLPFKNKDNLLARISQMKANTYQAVKRYKDRSFDSTTIKLKWFEYAYFLDTTGFIRETIEQVSVL